MSWFARGGRTKTEVNRENEWNNFRKIRYGAITGSTAERGRDRSFTGGERRKTAIARDDKPVKITREKSEIYGDKKTAENRRERVDRTLTDRRERVNITPTDGGGEFRQGVTFQTFRGEDARDKTERQHIRELKLLRRRLGVLFLIVAVFVALSGLILLQFSGSFAKVTSNSANLTAADTARYEKLINEYFQQNPFERFSFSRRDKALLSYVTAAAPEISAIAIRGSGFARTDLKLTFREPVAQWIAGGVTDYVDSSGVVFKHNFFAAPAISITDDSGLTPTDGVATSANFLSFVGRTAADLTKNGANLTRVVIPRDAIRYADFYLSGRDYPFKVQIDRDPASQAADILAMAKYLDAHQIVPQYVDCRVAGKAYWK